MSEIDHRTKNVHSEIRRKVNVRRTVISASGSQAGGFKCNRGQYCDVIALIAGLTYLQASGDAFFLEQWILGSREFNPQVIQFFDGRAQRESEFWFQRNGFGRPGQTIETMPSKDSRAESSSSTVIIK